MAQFNIRDLPEITAAQIATMKQRHGLTATQIVIMAMDRMYQQEGGAMKRETITLTDATLRGMDIGIIVECNGTQIGHWPMGMDEAEERATEQYPGATIERQEAGE